ncbi:unnamed protein product [Dovyalis caffra]|uniref:Uncharacterized protein n=1 Tax=Dovyalis caffra TaxID=77055 RepID=A0AAV1QUM0_9ROSI|nr:unnamed protein product [Dovyalis caffra]
MDFSRHFGIRFGVDQQNYYLPKKSYVQHQQAKHKLDRWLSIPDIQEKFRIQFETLSASRTFSLPKRARTCTAVRVCRIWRSCPTSPANPPAKKDYHQAYHGPFESTTSSFPRRSRVVNPRYAPFIERCSETTRFQTIFSL